MESDERDGSRASREHPTCSIHHGWWLSVTARSSFWELPVLLPRAEGSSGCAGAAVLRGGLSRSPWTGVGSWQDALCGAEGG